MGERLWGGEAEGNNRDVNAGTRSVGGGTRRGECREVCAMGSHNNIMDGIKGNAALRKRGWKARVNG